MQVTEVIAGKSFKVIQAIELTSLFSTPFKPLNKIPLERSANIIHGRHM
jgi:hypothetical protein